MRPLSVPLKVSLDVTSRCLLHCRHCRAAETVSQHTLALDEILRILDDLGRMGVFRIALSGGEPFLREDIVEVIGHAHAVSAGRVIVSTSGLLLTDHVLAELYPLRDRLTLKISLDGPPAIHDAIRGREGACRAAHEAIRACVERGLEVQVTTTLMRDNAAHIEEILALAAATGCSRHYLVELIPVGRATQEMALSRDERRRLSRSIALARKEMAREGYAIVARLPFSGGTAQGLTCSAGISECGILCDGRIVGCRLLPGWGAGNALQRPLSEAWADPHAFAAYRQWEAGDCGETCARCSAAGSCRGGCRAYAVGMSGDFYAPDSRCLVACPQGQQHVDGALQQDHALQRTEEQQGDVQGTPCAGQ